MATLASHSRKNVLAVVEINKIRQVVHLHPHDRALLLYRFFELFNCNCLLLQHGVAIHAKTGWRHSPKNRARRLSETTATAANQEKIWSRTRNGICVTNPAVGFARSSETA